VRLTEQIPIPGGVLALHSWSIDTNALIADGSASLENILLRPDNEDPVNPEDLEYALSVILHLTTNLASYDEFGNVIVSPGIPVNEIGLLGTQIDPITLQAQLNPVPIPGSSILFLSGIAALVTVRRRVKSKGGD
jgi:hypothetical protein